MATVCTMTSALAPGYVVETKSVGGAISGYSATGSLNREMIPVSTRTRLTTMASRGRSMKILENIDSPLLSEIGFDGHSRKRLVRSFCDDGFPRFQSLLNELSFRCRIARRDIPFLHLVRRIENVDIRPI